MAKVTKHEVDRDFPAEAYAYVPDRTKPSTWKLRLQNKDGKVTRAQLGAAAAAFSPGGFRGQKVKIPAADVKKVKERIRKAYIKLAVDPEEIPRWIRESATVAPAAVSVQDVSPLVILESADDKGVAKIRIIQPGFNVGQSHFYPREVLARDHAAFEGALMFADHPTETEQRERPERSIRDLVGVVENVEVAGDGSLLGSAKITAGWLRDQLAEFRSAGLLATVGVSIHALIEAAARKIENVETLVVETITKVVSVDFVTVPGAGGGVLVYESSALAGLNLAALHTNRPDLVAELAIELGEKTMDVEAKLEELQARILDAESKIKELTAKLEETETERDEARAALDKAQQETARAVVREALDKALAESKLPKPAADRLRRELAECDKVDAIAVAVKAEQEYLESLDEAGGKVTGLGATTESTSGDFESEKALFDSRRAQYESEGRSKDEAERMARSFVRG